MTEQHRGTGATYEVGSDIWLLIIHEYAHNEVCSLKKI